ncbi:MAG: aminoglycoside phosphotransferase family protein [Thermoplasmatota archaeon]
MDRGQRVEMSELTEENAVEYLEGRLDLRANGAEVTALGGGISNQVIMVRWDNGCAVLKQPFPKLRVEEDWPADLRRIHIETSALRLYDRLVRESGLSRVSIPEVLDEDRENHLVIMGCIPLEAAGMWKTELLAGQVDLSVAERVGELLGKVQARSAQDPWVREEFAFKEHFDELRIDPYHRTAAANNPDVAPLIGEEEKRIMGVGMSIVHGDYSPKSVMVDRSQDPPRLWLFDMEVAHWGDPSFDTGFMLNHLFIKSMHRREEQEAYLEAAMRFWRAYDRSTPWDIEFSTVKELGVLMLSRVDGKSPVEYISSEETWETLREVAKRSLRDDTRDLGSFADLVREVSA